MFTPPVLWTIGHSDHEFDDFARLLGQEQIEFLADVRSSPYSRHAPQFNRDALQASARSAEVGYVFLGDELGGRPSRDDHYDNDGHALYSRMARQPGFVDAVERLLAGAQRHRIALLCSEGEPRDCHRRLLVGKVLTDRGAVLRHILRDGSVLVETSIDLDGGNQASLFGGDDERWRSTRSVLHRRRPSTSSVG